tara:strand:+ start:301 stop:1590 length:1290 start_codon:yes stop_codon:yes gene_type:complete
MADTLAEIHKATLQSSDFNSSGEATLFTTNSSTKHVIKSIHVKEGDTNFTVAPTLNVSDHDIVTLTANASGQEIVGPSTAVKLKTTTFPLRYEDREFVHQQGSSEYNAITFPTVNEVEGKTATLNTNNNPIGHSNFTTNYAQRAIYTELGPNNYTMFIYSNGNNQTLLQIRQSNGTLVANHSDAYHPWWYDDKQYAYRYSGAGGYIQRIDVYTGTLNATWKQHVTNVSNSSYSRMMGVNDAQGNPKYLAFWPTYNQGFMYYYDFDNDLVGTWISNNVSNVVADYSRTMRLLMKSSGDMSFLYMDSNSTIREYPFIPTSSSTPTYTNVNRSTGVQLWPTHAQGMAVVGSRLYYYSDSNSGTPSARLEYIDFDLSGDSRFVDTGQTFQTNVGNYGYSVNLNKTIPTSTEISNRTYSINPSFQIRMTGITST